MNRVIGVLAHVDAGRRRFASSCSITYTSCAGVDAWTMPIRLWITTPSNGGGHHRFQ